ncbi:hypothetical protein ACHQM5_029811 [Ranunculus cassubicifolius]
MTSGYMFITPCVAASIHDLPDDVLVEILCKLPIKDLNSCKYISKLWNFLISRVCVPIILASNPVYSLIFPVVSEENGEWSFTDIRSSNDHRTREISLRESDLDIASLPFHPSPDAFRDCCNGLLLYFDMASKHYFLCNPYTHQIINIPNPPGKVIYLKTALIFDSHYKIVNMGGSQPKLNIFSLVTRQWSVHNLGPYFSYDGQTWDTRFIFLDGSIYKLSVARYVLKIDLNNPADCREITIPETRPFINVGCLGVSQGDLHYGWDNIFFEMMVWTLKTGSSDCPDEWILKYSISFEYFKHHPTMSKNNPRILAFHPTTEKVIIGNCLGLFFYEPNTRKLEVICVFSSGKKVIPRRYPVYLFSPNVTRLEKLSQGI